MCRLNKDWSGGVLMSKREIERKALKVGLLVNIVITIAGVWIFSVTHIQALFLDFFFSFINFASSIMAVVISNVSSKKTKTYPDGLYFLEPLYAILKSLLTITILIISVITTSIRAYHYFINGTGDAMNLGPVLPYTLIMVILCIGLGFFNKAQNKKIGNISTILTAESRSNFIDGLLSFGIGVAVILLYFVDVDGKLGFLHFTGDFFITTILVIITLKQPVIVLLNSFIEISGGALSNTIIKNHINEIIVKHTKDIVQIKNNDIHKIGMHIKIRISLQNELNQDAVRNLVEARQKIVKELKETYSSLDLYFNI
jgi:divalent metal cation (Fe/Co/Zn/Cd) transporter